MKIRGTAVLVSDPTSFFQVVRVVVLVETSFRRCWNHHASQNPSNLIVDVETIQTTNERLLSVEMFCRNSNPRRCAMHGKIQLHFPKPHGVMSPIIGAPCTRESTCIIRVSMLVVDIGSVIKNSIRYLDLKPSRLVVAQLRWECVVLHRDVKVSKLLLCNHLSMLAIRRVMSIFVIFVCHRLF